MSPRAIALLAILLYANPALAELMPANEKAATLLKQGMAFDGAGKFDDALKSFRESALADPKASTPLSNAAYLYLRLSRGATGTQADQLRNAAGANANAALKLDERDTIAMEVLRALADDIVQPRHESTPATQKIVQEGEALFNEKQYAAAAEKYQQAYKLDPANVEALLLIGDCAFMQGDMLHAEQVFRQATQLDPLYGPAWRFLFDALLRQKKIDDAESAALGAIAALPSERQSWTQLGMVTAHRGQPLAPFRLVRRANFNNNTITMDPDIGLPDSAIWMAYGLSQGAASTGKDQASPFARELAAWESTMKVVEETGDGDKLKDNGLRAMLRFHTGGQLKAAVFLLLYREAYRPDFEAWKKAEPAALKRFIDTFHVGL